MVQFCHIGNAPCREKGACVCFIDKTGNSLYYLSSDDTYCPK